MAYFAQLNQNNVVIRVISVNNPVILDENEQESEEIGIAFCKSLCGEETIWKQTSYNANFRVRYAGTGYTYDESLDAFIPPKPHNSWILNLQTCNWEAPVPMPEYDPQEGYYVWNEELNNWQFEKLPPTP